MTNDVQMLILCLSYFIDTDCTVFPFSYQLSFFKLLPPRFDNIFREITALKVSQSFPYLIISTLINKISSNR